MTINRLVLVDNATLSGVERLIGESQTRNLNNIENDILCFDKLITAILFSDSIISVDDYKEEYRSERLKKFDFIDFMEIDKVTYQKLADDAADFAKRMIFTFDGSKPAGDVVAFFESLRIYPQLRWDVFVSSEYITLSLLVNDTKHIRYETSIDSMFRNEVTNAASVKGGDDFEAVVSVEGRPDISDVKDLVHAFAGSNPSFRGSQSRSVLERIVFGYGWAAERSHFYNAVAAMNEADPTLAPLRDAFGESCCRLDTKSQVNNLLERLKSTSSETLAKIVEASGRAHFVMKMPFFTAHLISSVDTPAQCIERALKMRDQRDFRDCRTLLLNLNHLTAEDRYSEINMILRHVEQSCASFLKKYAVSLGGSTAVSFSMGATGPSIGTSFKLDWLLSGPRNKPFSRIFRNISQDMLNVERLGGLYDKLVSSIRQHKDATFPIISVTPKYMERRARHTGRPAEL